MFRLFDDYVDLRDIKARVGKFDPRWKVRYMKQSLVAAFLQLMAHC